jgi:nucleotide-binding universal stress UspA family protein
MQILLAVDSIEINDLAVRQFRERPWPAGSTVEALCVVDPSYDVPHVMERAQDLANDAAARIRECGLAASALALAGDPKHTIVERASRTNVDFVMLGSHEIIGRRRFLLGSVAKSVLRTAPCSVEIVRPGADAAPGSRPLKVLLAVDDSECSQAATRSIASRPWPAGTEVRVLSVVEMTIPMFYVPYSEGSVEALRAGAMKRAQDAIRDAERTLADAGLSTSESLSVLLSGPKTVILDEAESWGADLIVVGSHGRRGINRLLLGSTSEAVAMHAHCSVEMIRATPVPAHIGELRLSPVPA